MPYYSVNTVIWHETRDAVIIISPIRTWVSQCPNFISKLARWIHYTWFLDSLCDLDYNGVMNNKRKINQIVKRLRATREYAQWVRINTRSACDACGSYKKALHCHHVIDIFHVVQDVWREFGDDDQTLTLLKEMHAKDDTGPSRTLCEACHAKRHPLQDKVTEIDASRARIWTFAHRKMGFRFAQSRNRAKPGEIGYVALQALLGLNWGVLNGYMDSRVLVLKPKQFAALAGKKLTTSLKNTLRHSLSQLQENNLISAWHLDGTLEVHYSRQQLQSMMENPWFYPVELIQASTMMELTLRIHLGFIGRTTYRIGTEKLAWHLNYSTQRRLAERVIETCQVIPSVKSVTVDDRNIFTFTFGKRKASPVHSLRRLLDDSISG